MKKILLVWLIGSGILFTSHLALSTTETEQRAKLKTPPVKIYQSMLRFVDKQNYGKIEASLSFVKPVILAIKKKWDIDMRSEIRDGVVKQDEIAVRRSIHKLIFLDMEWLLYKSADKDLTNKERRRQIRIAYLNYLLLSPTVKKKQFLADQRVKRIFHRLHAILGTSRYAQSASNVDATVIENQIHSIEKEMFKLFPEWHLQKLLRKEKDQDVDHEKH